LVILEYNEAFENGIVPVERPKLSGAGGWRTVMLEKP
jgi:hypothetical protein